MAGWTDFRSSWTRASLVLSDTIPAYRGIVTAINERARVCGVSELTVPAETGLQAYGSTAQNGIVENVINKFNELYPKFVEKSEAVGGEFTDGSLHIWNSTTLLAALRDGEDSTWPDLDLPTFANVDPNSSDLVYALYKLINLLTWQHETDGWTYHGAYPLHTIEPDGTNPGTGLVRNKNSSGSTYANAVAAWPANWSDLIGFTDIRHYCRRITASNYELIRRQSWFEYTPRIGSEFNYDADLYFYASAFPQGSPVFYGDGLFPGENTYGRIVSMSAQNDGTIFDTESNVPQGAPQEAINVNEARGWMVIPQVSLPAVGTYGTGVKAIIKWDVTDGFEYV